jgi:hypothetical protein
MTKPLIQIDDLVREMTDEEYANYQAVVASSSEPLNLDTETTQE